MRMVVIQGLRTTSLILFMTLTMPSSSLTRSPIQRIRCVGMARREGRQIRRFGQEFPR